jgi:hypothetical protein
LTSASKGSLFPERAVALGHHVGVGHDPQAFARLPALDGGHQVGPLLVAHPLVRRVMALYVDDAALLEPGLQGQGFLPLAVAPRFGGQGRYGRKELLQLYDARLGLIQIRERLFYCIHAVSPLFAVAGVLIGPPGGGYDAVHVGSRGLPP